MKQKFIKILVVEHNEEPRIETIENNLKSMQEIVGGLIECLSLTTTTDLVCNEEGKINGMGFNRYLYNVGINDAVFGTFFVVGVNNQTGEFISLTDAQISRWKKKFRL